jgi:hypothetical protein
VKEFEEVGTFLPEVIGSVVDARKFQDVIKLVGFSPAKFAQNDLDNINAALKKNENKAAAPLQIRKIDQSRIRLTLRSVRTNKEANVAPPKHERAGLRKDREKKATSLQRKQEILSNEKTPVDYLTGSDFDSG